MMRRAPSRPSRPLLHPAGLQLRHVCWIYLPLLRICLRFSCFRHLTMQRRATRKEIRREKRPGAMPSKRSRSLVDTSSVSNRRQLGLPSDPLEPAHSCALFADGGDRWGDLHGAPGPSVLFIPQSLPSIPSRSFSYPPPLTASQRRDEP